MSRTIFFAGGGTGGHIYPNLAIYEQLCQIKPDTKAHFLVSGRAVDEQIMTKTGIDFTPLTAKPLSARPKGLFDFARGFIQSRRAIQKLIKEHDAAAVVVTGGFVSMPAAVAANKAGLPLILVNLDAVPGKANRWIVGRATKIYTSYPHPLFENAMLIGLPLRRQAIGPADAKEARIGLGLDPDKPMLLVTGASQGAMSINQMMMALAQLSPSRQKLADWQILHLAGDKDTEILRRGYADAGLDAHVQGFCDRMGLAWRGATLAISRCGAGSVAEVWANATPTIFLPYPYHKDQHQKLNARVLVEAGAAMMFTDLVDPLANARQISEPLLSLMSNDAQRQKMTELLESEHLPDGAQAVASWLAKLE